MSHLLERLEEWYSSQCDGEWEHRWGVQIETLDNPGWLVRIDLVGTSLATASFEKSEKMESGDQWLECRTRDGQWVGAGGPSMLRQILAEFLDWTRASEGGGPAIR